MFDVTATGGCTRTVRLDDHVTEVFHRLDGEGPPFVFLHALGLDLHMWDPVVRQLPADCAFVAYDLRCHGGASSARPAETLHTMADDLVALLNRLDVATAVVAGLSMGGAVAQAFAVDHPERVAGLVLAATATVPQPAYLQRARAAVEFGVASQLAETLDRWFSPEFLTTNGAAVRYARDRMLRIAAERWAAGWHTLATIDTHDQLGRIRTPTTVVAGACDPVSTPRDMRLLAEAIPGANYVEIPGVRHMISLEAPDRLAAVFTAVHGTNIRTGAARPGRARYETSVTPQA